MSQIKKVDSIINEVLYEKGQTDYTDNQKSFISYYINKKCYKAEHSINHINEYMKNAGLPAKVISSIKNLMDEHALLKQMVTGEIDNFLNDHTSMTMSYFKVDEERNQLATKSAYDSLTSLYSRDFVYEELIRKTKIFTRNRERAFSVMMVDLDYFKKVNDTYGHLIGDRILKTFGRLLKTVIRDSDTAGRIGGEEFLIILPETSINEAVIVAEKIRIVTELLCKKDYTDELFQECDDRIDHTFVLNKIDKIMEEIKLTDENFEKACSGLTVSIGLTQISDYDTKDFSDESIDIIIKNIIKRADDALYSSKNTGRNKVSVVNSGKEYDLSSPVGFRQFNIEMDVDSATGLYKREHLVNEIKKATNLYQRNNSRIFSLLMINVDDLKSINNKNGIKIADKILEIIGSFLISIVRDSDYVGELHGGQFVVILPETDISESMTVAKKIRNGIEFIGKDIEEINEIVNDNKDKKCVQLLITRIKEIYNTYEEEFKIISNAFKSVTVSIGATKIIMKDIKDFQERGVNSVVLDIIERTEKALVYSKANGKNRIAVRLPESHIEEIKNGDCD